MTHYPKLGAVSRSRLENRTPLAPEKQGIRYTVKTWGDIRFLAKIPPTPFDPTNRTLELEHIAAIKWFTDGTILFNQTEHPLALHRFYHTYYNQPHPEAETSIALSAAWPFSFPTEGIPDDYDGTLNPACAEPWTYREECYSKETLDCDSSDDESYARIPRKQRICGACLRRPVAVKLSPCDRYLCKECVKKAWWFSRRDSAPWFWLYCPFPGCACRGLVESVCVPVGPNVLGSSGGVRLPPYWWMCGVSGRARRRMKKEAADERLETFKYTGGGEDENARLTYKDPVFPTEEEIESGEYLNHKF